MPTNNALKSGVYSNALMAWESAQEVEDAFQKICKEFEVKGIAGELLARQLVQTTLQVARLERSQANKVATVLNRRQARKEFADQVGLSTLIVDSLPDWFFSIDIEEYERAANCVQCVEQAKDLRKNHSADLMASVQKVYPELWQMVMESDSRIRKYTFGEWIAAKYQNSSPDLNLRALVQDLEKTYEFEMLWCYNEERYMSVIRNILAQAEIDVRTDPNQMRAEVMLHKKMQSLMYQLGEIRHHSQQARVLSGTKKLLQQSKE